MGKTLGRAFEYNRAEEIFNGLRAVVQQTEFLADLPSLIRVRNGMSHEDLHKHILFASGSANNSYKVTGAHSVIQLLQEADLIVDDNGTWRVKSGSDTIAPPQESSTTQTQAPNAETINPAPEIASTATPLRITSSINPVAIAINIQLQLPETENPVVYENLFKALKAHLLTPDASS